MLSVRSEVQQQTQRVVFIGREEDFPGRLSNVFMCERLVLFVWLKLACKRQLAVYRLRIENKRGAALSHILMRRLQEDETHNINLHLTAPLPFLC